MAARSRIGFIGLGNMGGPMAINLCRAGFDVVGFDVVAAKLAAVVDRGAQAALDVKSAVAGADFVLTSLPGPAEVGAIAEEIVSTMAADSIWIDLSTNDLECAAHIATIASHHGIAILDAPVTGGAEGAAAGTLRVLVGGDAATHARCTEVFQAIGTSYDLIGPYTAGYVAKISQVILCYLNSVCLTEALLLGVKGGVDPAQMLDIIQHSTGRSYVADRYGPEILNGGYDDTFHLGLAKKDLHLALALADQVGASLPFTADVTALYDDATEEFGFDAPHLIAMQHLERRNELILHNHEPGSR